MSIFAKLITIIILVLLPMVPAVFIFQKFPEGDVRTTGPFKGLNLKLRGAFAAYFIVLLVCVGFVPSIFSSISIQETNGYVYSVKGYFKLIDEKGKPLDINNNDSVLSNIQPIITLSNNPNGSDFTLELPSPQLLKGAILNFRSKDHHYSATPADFAADKLNKSSNGNNIDLDTIIISRYTPKLPTPPPVPRDSALTRINQNTPQGGIAQKQGGIVKKH